MLSQSASTCLSHHKRLNEKKTTKTGLKLLLSQQASTCLSHHKRNPVTQYYIFGCIRPIPRLGTYSLGQITYLGLARDLFCSLKGCYFRRLLMCIETPHVRQNPPRPEKQPNQKWKAASKSRSADGRARTKCTTVTISLLELHTTHIISGKKGFWVA